MNRSEWTVTVLGLLGSFLLPWPGEGGGVEATVREAAPVQAASRADGMRRCTAARPITPSAAWETEGVSAPAKRG